MSIKEKDYIDKKQEDKNKMEYRDFGNLAGYFSCWFVGGLLMSWFAVYGLYTKGLSHYEAVIYLAILPIAFIFMITSVGLYLNKKWARYPGFFCAAMTFPALPFGPFIAIKILKFLNRN